MVIRLFTKNATGVATDGRWYAGDVNALQDAVAAQTDFTQTISTSVLAVGDSSIQLLKYGTAEARMTSSLRVDGIVRGLGGTFSGTFTTTARDAIGLGSRPYGLVITNTNTNTLQWNAGTDPAPVWRSLIDEADARMALLSVPAANQLQTTGQLRVSRASGSPGLLLFTTGEANPKGEWDTDGKLWFGPGGATAVDTNLYRSAVGSLKTDGQIIVTGDFEVAGNNTGKLYFGSAADTNLYRDAANVLKTDGHLRIAWNSSVALELLGTGGGITFGGDVSIARTSSTSIQASSSFYAVGNAGGQVGLTAQAVIGNVGPSGQSGVLLGSAGDTYLYRNSAAGLATNSSLNLTTTGALVMWSNAASGSRVLENYLLASDSQPALRIWGNGMMEWGPGGASGRDLILQRTVDPNSVVALGVSGGFYLVSDPGGATGDTGLWAYFHGIGARRIIAGAAGSGSNGGGYRQLQILN